MIGGKENVKMSLTNKTILHSVQVKRSQLRERLHIVDKEGIQERRHRRLHRRIYNVEAPNYVWHIDSNHKLIRWRFIISGGVDGFSRFVVFLKCIDNNKSKTVYGCFKEAVAKYGIPKKVRTDQGMENLDIARYMLDNGYGMITGKSVHNQRVERMWRDVYEGVLSYFHDLFFYMEEESILDPLDERHIYALHFVFLSNINHKLDTWNEAWANHRLRTVRSTPKRLFLAGAINVNTDRPSQTADEADTVNANQLLNESRPIFQQSTYIVSQQCQQELEHLDTDFEISRSGVQIFIQAVHIILRHDSFPN
jgi:hypothetical protein